MAETADLIARLEAAIEGSPELDAEIAVAVFETVNTGDDLIYAKLPHKDDGCARGTYWRKSRSGMSLQTALPYTRSLDAALLLTPYSGPVYWTIGRFAVQGELSIRTRIWPPGPAPGPNEGWHGKAATPALSFCAAALRAKGET